MRLDNRKAWRRLRRHQKGLAPPAAALFDSCRGLRAWLRLRRHQKGLAAPAAAPERLGAACGGTRKAWRRLRRHQKGLAAPAAALFDSSQGLRAWQRLRRHYLIAAGGAQPPGSVHYKTCRALGDYTSNSAVSIKGLTKSYGPLKAVDGVDLEVAEGEVFALLGPNGAGKTTTVEILEGFRNRDAGEVLVLGRDPAIDDLQLKSQVGIVLQSTGMDPYLTVAESIDLFGSYYPRPRPTDEVMELVGLTEKRDTRVTKLSGGQQRRLDVGIALAGDPALLFLDEPTTGFDPGARRNAWEVIKSLAALGKTVFLTTHYMDEAQYLADRVAIISKGKIIAQGPPSTIGGRDIGSSVVRFKVPEEADLPAEVLAAARVVNGYLEFAVPNPTHFLHDLTSWALQRKIDVEGLEVKRPSLEDVYLEMTKDAEIIDAPEPVGRRARRRASAG